MDGIQHAFNDIVSSLSGKKESVGQAHKMDRLHKYIQQLATPAGKVGEMKAKIGAGESAILGGYSGLKSYADSYYSKSKEDMIRALAKELSSQLKMSSAFAEKEDIGKVVSKIQSLAPPPGRKISSDNQKKVCVAIAKALNKVYGRRVIDVDGSSNDKICNDAMEFLGALLTGLNAEYVAISADVSKTVKNMNTLKELISKASDKVINDALRSSDTKVQNAAKQNKELIDRVKVELDRQIGILAHLTNSVVSPLEKSLIGLLEENKEFRGLVRDLKEGLGKDKFAQKIGLMLSGVQGVARAAEIVDKQLKKMGMSVAEYKAIKNKEDLEAKLFDKIASQRPNAKELNKLMKAMRLVLKQEYNHNHNELAGALGKTGGVDDDDDDDDEETNKARRLVSRRYTSDIALSKALTKQEKHRKLLFKELKKRLIKKHQKLISAVKIMAKKIGNSIEPSSELKDFIKAFGNLDVIDKNKIEEALSGYRKDLTAKQERSAFLMQVNRNLDRLKPLMEKGSGREYFREIHNAFVDIVKLFDEFNDKFIKALEEIPLEKRKYFDQHGNLVKGSKENAYGPFIPVNELNKADYSKFATLKGAKRDLQYYFKISGVRKNVKLLSGDLSKYRKDYENILGDEIAYMCDTVEKVYDAIVENKYDGAAGNNNIKYDAAGDSKNKELKKFWKFQKESQIEFLKAVEAIDLYLIEFTTHLSNNPDEYKNVLALLDQIEVVTRWFTEESGNNLVKLFELEDDDFDNFNARVADDGKHYYENMAGQTPKQVDDLKFEPDSAGDDESKKFDRLRERVRNCVKSIRALENILSIFSHMGDSNKKMFDKIFMSPGQIYKAFEDYIVASALAHHNANKAVIGVSLLKPSGNNNLDDNSPSIYGAAITDNLDIADDNKGSVLITHQYNAAGLPAGIVPIVPIAPAGYGTSGKPLSYNDYKGNVQPVTMEWCDELFVLTLKAICAKVLTVANMYNMLEKPNYNEPSLSALRVVLGGEEGGYDVPNIRPEYYECYHRGLLLLEWYKEMFNFTGSGNNNLSHEYKNREDYGADASGRNFVITMLPYVDGPFKNLFKLIFVTTGGIRDGSYSRPQLAKILKELNSIASKFGGNCRKMVGALVDEVNRCYGLVKKSELQKYWSEQYKQYSNEAEFGDKKNRKNVDEYDILDTKKQHKRGTAPSDHLSEHRSKISESKEKQRLWVRKHMMEHLKKLHRFMSEQLRANSCAGAGVGVADNDEKSVPVDKFSFDATIQQKKSKLQNCKTNKERFDKVYESLQNIHQKLIMNNERAMLFHETVKVPYMLLNIMLKQLIGFNSFCHGNNYTAYQLNNPALVNATDIGMGNGVGETTYRNLLAKLQNYFNAKQMAVKNHARIVDYNNGNIRDSYIDIVNNVLIGHQFMAKLIHYVRLFSCDFPELFNISINDSLSVHMDFTGLHEMCNALLKSANDSLNNLRSDVDGEVVNKYNNKLIQVKDLLIELLFENRDGLGLQDCSASVSEALKQIGNDNNAGRQNILTRVIQAILLWGGPAGNTESNDLYKGVFKFIQPFKSGWEAKTMGEKVNEIALRAEAKKLGDYEDKKLLADDVKDFLDNKLTDGAGNVVGNAGNDNTIILNVRDSSNNTVYGWDASSIEVNGAGDITDFDTNAFNADPYVANQVGAVPAVRFEVVNVALECKQTVAVAGVGVGAAPVNVNVNVIHNPARLNKFREKLDTRLAGIDLRGADGVSGPIRNIINNIAGQVVPPDLAEYKQFRPFLVIKNKWRSDPTDAKGLVHQLNSELNSLLHNFTDNQDKIYEPLVKGLNAGILSSCIENNQGWRDFNFVAGQPVGRVNENYPLSATNSLAIKSILSQKEKDGRMKFLNQNLSDVNHNIREKMKAGLPVYIRRFKHISCAAGVIHKFVEKSKLKERLVATAGGAVQGADGNGALGLASALLNDGAENRSNYFLQLCNSIQSACKAILKCLNDCHKDLNDTPKYMETYEGSLKDNDDPLTPLSFATEYVLSDNKLHPHNEQVGSNEFKFLYGSRLLLGRNDVNINSDNLANVSRVLEIANSNRTSNNQMSKQLYDTSIRNQVQVVRLLHSAKLHRISVVPGVGNPNMLYFNHGGAIAVANPHVQLYGANRAVGGVAGALAIDFNGNNWKNQVVRMENNKDKETVRELSERVVTRAGAPGAPGAPTPGAENPGRACQQALNILDMNIVPINIHMMVREMPLVNIHNYAYTFDEFVKQKTGAEFTDNPAAPANAGMHESDDNQFRNATHTLGRLLIRPYQMLAENDFANLQKIMQGNTGAPLGRPKYLSDQLWNKALVQSTYVANDAAGSVLQPDNNTYEVTAAAAAPQPNDQPDDKDSENVHRTQHATGVIIDANASVVFEVKSDGKLTEHGLANNSRVYGIERYNTKLVRNLQYLSNLHRFLRQCIRDKLSWVEDPVVKGTKILAENVTEYAPNDKFNEADFY